MLVELRVQHLGPIGDLTLVPGRGMTVLTGETGAGKTLVVEALALVLGGRARGQPVTTGAGGALVEARFTTEEPEMERVLTRAVPAEGRSRAWVDGRMATAQQLATAAAGLVDIHGQHDQYSLTTVSGRRRVLDAFAGSDLTPLEGARGEIEAIDRELRALGGDARAQAREADLLRFQLAEIDAAVITDADEDHRLAEEAAVLGDLTAHREAVERAVALLSGGDDDTGGGGTIDALRSAGSMLAQRPLVGELAGRVADLTVEIEDVVRELRAVGESWEDDPDRLSAVQDRRRELTRLRRKYGDELSQVLNYAEAARRRLAELDGAEERTAALLECRSSATDRLEEAERVIRAVRVRAAAQMSDAATDRLRALAMPRAVMEVSIGRSPAGDDVEILFTADGGMPSGAASTGAASTGAASTDSGPAADGLPRRALLPLARSASGGELSRAAVALHLVASAGPDTMVFDEVDAGVGGQAAVALAAALHEVSRHHQVLVVTHLPQVAAVADTHVALARAEGAGATTTRAEALDDAGRVVELARMLSGHPDSPTARAHATELLGRAQAWAGEPWPGSEDHASTTTRGARR